MSHADLTIHNPPEPAVTRRKEPRKRVVEAPQTLIDAFTVASMLGIGLSTVRRWDSNGRLPRPVRIGHRAVRWRREEILAWIGAGCPDRRAWDAMQTR